MNELQLLLLIVALAITVFLIKKGANIGIVMLIDSAFLIIGTQMEFSKAVNTFLNGALSDKTILFIAILVFIMILENIMRSRGMIKDIAETLRLLISSKTLSSISMPIVLGMLPSPGGARFSCPLVDEIAGSNTSNEDKAFLNYWFRHVWMDAFMLYPGMILASQLLDVSTLDFFTRMLLFMVFWFFLGILFVKTKIANNPDTSNDNKINISKTEKFKLFINLIKSSFPIILIILLNILLVKLNLKFLYKQELTISIAFTLLILAIYKKVSIKEILEILIKSPVLNYTLLIVGVMVFNEYLQEVNALKGLMDIIANNNISPDFLIFLLPFIAGSLSGVAVTFVSLTFPLLISMNLIDNIWIGAIAYASGFLGVMATPLHLCFLMSCEFFKVKINKIMPRVLFALSIVMVFLLLIFYLIG